MGGYANTLTCPEVTRVDPTDIGRLLGLDRGTGGQNDTTTDRTTRAARAGRPVDRDTCKMSSRPPTRKQAEFSISTVTSVRTTVSVRSPKPMSPGSVWRCAPRPIRGYVITTVTVCWCGLPHPGRHSPVNSGRPQPRFVRWSALKHTQRSVSIGEAGHRNCSPNREGGGPIDALSLTHATLSGIMTASKRAVTSIPPPLAGVGCSSREHSRNPRRTHRRSPLPSGPGHLHRQP